MRITFSQQPSETGLARVAQTPRGYICKINGAEIGRISAHYNRIGNYANYAFMWYTFENAELRIPYRNTSAEGITFATREEARDHMKAWLKEIVQ